ncbi:MAG: transporter, partial [Acidobacteria bacterium]|nr:transporter [Acidobacteriota bacterium]
MILRGRGGMRRTALAGFCTVCLATRVRAQEVIEPDRPDVTNGTHIVDIGLLQIEVGGLFTRTTPGQQAFGSPFTARVGVSEWLELRVGTDGLLSQTDGVTRQTGVGNTQLGAKLRLWADPGGIPVLSILPTVNLPTASADRGLGSGDADFTVVVLTGTDIGRHWHADVNYGVGAIGAGGDQPHFVQHLASISVSVAATDNWNPYVETYWFSQQDADGGHVAAIDAGGIYQIGTRFAIDGGVQIGLHGGPADVAAFGGFSMIVGDVLGGHGPE